MALRQGTQVAYKPRLSFFLSFFYSSSRIDILSNAIHIETLLIVSEAMPDRNECFISFAHAFIGSLESLGLLLYLPMLKLSACSAIIGTTCDLQAVNDMIVALEGIPMKL